MYIKSLVEKYVFYVNIINFNRCWFYVVYIGYIMYLKLKTNVKFDLVVGIVRFRF